MITGEEFAQRMRQISRMRALALGLQRAALEAHRRGEIPFAPATDIRSDPEHWRRLLAERARPPGH